MVINSDPIRMWKEMTVLNHSIYLQILRKFTDYLGGDFESVQTFVECKSTALPLHKLWACGPTLSSTNYMTGLCVG
jgi:hypothetical protein